MATATSRSRPTSRPGAVRKPSAASVAIAALPVLLLVAALNLLNLLASGYERRAEQRLDVLPDAAAESDSTAAAALSYWNARRHALRGWISAEEGDIEAAVASYAKALRRAPADAVLWAEYAQALARNRVFDGRLTWATLRALTLAPASPAVRQGVSRMGFSYWRQGEADLQELWRQSFRWELDHNRASFLRTVEDDGLRATFCARHAEVLGEAAWCGKVAP